MGEFRARGVRIASLGIAKMSFPMVSGVPADFEACRALDWQVGRSACLAVQIQPSPQFLARNAGGTHSSDSRVARRETAFPGNSEKSAKKVMCGPANDEGDAAGREAVLQAFREEEPAPGTRSGGRRSPKPAIPCPRPPQRHAPRPPPPLEPPRARDGHPTRLLPDVAGSLHVEGPLRVDDPHAPSTVRRGLRVGRPCMEGTRRTVRLPCPSCAAARRPGHRAATQAEEQARGDTRHP